MPGTHRSCWFHPPASLGILELEVNVPLGVLPSPAYRSSTVELEPGSTLMLFTDGLVESAERPIEVGLERLVEAVGAAGLATAGFAGVCSRLVSTMVPERTHDDIAVLGARLSRRPPGCA